MLKANFLEEMYENKLEFPGGRGDAKQKTFLGGSVDIFWNCTIGGGPESRAGIRNKYDLLFS